MTSVELPFGTEGNDVVTFVIAAAVAREEHEKCPILCTWYPFCITHANTEVLRKALTQEFLRILRNSRRIRV